MTCATFTPALGAEEVSTFARSNFFNAQVATLSSVSSKIEDRVSALRDICQYVMNAGQARLCATYIDTLLEDVEEVETSHRSEDLQSSITTFQLEKLFLTDYEKFESMMEGIIVSQEIRVADTAPEISTLDSHISDVYLNFLEGVYWNIRSERSLAESRVDSNLVASLETETYNLFNARAKEKFLTALSHLASLDISKHSHYTILSMTQRVATFLRETGESHLARRVLNPFQEYLLNIGEYDPNLLRHVINTNYKSLDRDGIEPRKLLEALDVQTLESDELFQSTKPLIRAELCAQALRKNCVKQEFHGAITSNDSWLATQILDTWVTNFGPENLTDLTADFSQIRNFIKKDISWRGTDGGVDKGVRSLMASVSQHLYFLRIDWSFPEFEATLPKLSKTEYLLRRKAIELEGRQYSPASGLSLVAERDRRQFIHGLLNLKEIPIAYTQSDRDAFVYAMHRLLQRSIGSRASEASDWSRRNTKQGITSSRRDILVLHQQTVRALLKATDDLAERLSAKQRAFTEDGWGWVSGQIWGRLARDLIARKGNKLQQPGVIGDFEPLHANVIQENLRPNEALVMPVKAGSVLSTLCLRNDQQAYSPQVVDEARFDLHSRLLQLSLTATHPPNKLKDSEFPAKSAHFLYGLIFLGIESCLDGVDEIFYVPSLELAQIPPGVLLTELPSSKQRSDLSKFSWLISKHSFNVLDSPQELANRIFRQPMKDNQRSMLGVAVSSDNAQQRTYLGYQEGFFRPDQTAELPKIENAEKEIRSIAAELEHPSKMQKLLIDQDATERSVKYALELGFRYVSFATHALTSGEVKGLRQSALLLDRGNVNTEAIHTLYIAFFNRPANPVSLAVYLRMLPQDRAASVKELVAVANRHFEPSSEFKETIDSLSDVQLINRLYGNLLARDAEPAGLLFWASKLMREEMSLSEIALEIARNARGTDGVALSAKLRAAQAFTDKLSNSSKAIVAFSGDAAIKTSHNWLRTVSDESTAAFAIASLDQDVVCKSNITQCLEAAAAEAEAISDYGFDEGLLTATEIARLNINTELVSLSACNTSSFDQKPLEEDISGLAAAFKIAGAPQVLSTMWPADSYTAEKLNVGMFTKMREGDISAAEALAGSIRELVAADTGDLFNPAYRHPRFWGAFKVSGVK